MAKSDKEKYAELVAEAYTRLMDLAEADPENEPNEEGEDL